jgi:subtilisin family serine protease
MLVLLLPILMGALDTDPWSLVRVDVPDAPGAVATSRFGSLLLEAPEDGTPYRTEPVPVPDSFEAWEGEQALATEPWFNEGWDGSGVKLAIFDVQWFNAELRDHELGSFQTEDCEATPTCEAPMDTLRPSFSFEEGSHGVACAEVVRDLAPGVELYLVRVNGLTTMENAVDWAVREGIDIVSMSMSFFGDSFYDGTGAISATAARLADGGVLLVSSAGNYAQEHWLEDFCDDDGDGWHEFHRSGGPSGFLPIWLDGGGSRRVLVAWDQYGNCGDSDLDAYVFDAHGVVVGRSEDRQDASARSCEPVERVSAWAEDSGWYYLAIRLAGGDPATRFYVLAQDGEIYEAMAHGSVADPSANPTVFSVGAARASTYTQGGVESFSSQGPSHGGLARPSIAGPDGLTTSIYGETGFYGTSAATPAVAAAIADMMSKDGSLDARQAAEELQGAAISGQPAFEGWDQALGAGYARLPALDHRRGGCEGRPLVLPVLLWLPFFTLRRRLDITGKTYTGTTRARKAVLR